MMTSLYLRIELGIVRTEQRCHCPHAAGETWEHCLLMTRAMSFVASLLPNWIVSGPR